MAAGRQKRKGARKLRADGAGKGAGLFVRFRAALVGMAALLAAGCAMQGEDGARAPGAAGIGGADNKIVFGYRSDAPPFSYEAGGDVVAFSGFTAEICNLLAQQLASRPETAGLARGAVRVSAENRFTRLEDGDIDVLCGAASITPERLERVGFSTPVLRTGIAVAVPQGARGRFAALPAAPELGAALASALAKGGGRVGFRRGTTTENWLIASGIDDARGVYLVGFADHRDAIAALISGEIDVYMADQAILRGLARTEEAGIRVSEGTVHEETIALGTQRDADALREVLDGMLAELYRSGEIVPIFERHFGPMTAADRAFYQQLAAASG